MRLEEILQSQPVWRAARIAQSPPGIPTGFADLDAALPGRGWPTGELTELLGDIQGIGELQLVLPALAALSTSGKRVVWLAPPHVPYAPALAASRVDLVQLVMLQPRQRKDALWAAEQVLRSGATAALVAWLPRLRYIDLQRLALAAGAGRALAFLYRPAATAGESSPAALRLELQPGEAELVVRLLKRRGTFGGAVLRLAFPASRHALGRPALTTASARHDRTDRCLDLPVHA
jgi:cell division inhibitor SulA/protein ImuA